MRQIIEQPEPTLDDAFDYVSRLLLPALPEASRKDILEFAKQFHTCGAVWSAAFIRETPPAFNDRRCEPCPAVRRAELILAQAVPPEPSASSN